MAKDYTTVDGWPVAPNTAEAFLTRLKPAFERAFPGVTLHVYSGYRSYEGQVEIFTSRYRRGAYSPYGDYRWWDGSRWGRVSGEGTVAAPGTSNHQSGHALDIRDSGSDAGVTIAGNARSNWIRANAADYGFSPIGYTFAEPWHIEYTGDPWAGETTTGAGGTAVAPVIESEEDDVKLYRVTPKGRHYAVAPGFIKQITGKESVKAYEAAAGVKEAEIDGDQFTVVLGVNGISTVAAPVVDGQGRILDERDPSKGYVHGGSWARTDKAERFAFEAKG